MSKRDAGASITSYIEGGYAPEAVRNYLSLLGWSPKENREILELEETIRLFDLSGITRKNAHFDLDKCLWLNAQHLTKMPPTRLGELALPFLERSGITCGHDGKLEQVLLLVREKLKLLTDVPEWVSHFFTETYPFAQDAVAKVFGNPAAPERLLTLAEAFERLSLWSAETIEQALKETAAGFGAKHSELLLPTRVAVSGRASGPNLFPMLEILGRERSVARIRRALEVHAPRL
jgi:glutamyl-tRNA synthetase